MLQTMNLCFKVVYVNLTFTLHNNIHLSHTYIFKLFLHYFTSNFSVTLKSNRIIQITSDCNKLNTEKQSQIKAN